MAVPTGVTFNAGSDDENRLYVKVVGAYSKGTLNTECTWENCSYDVIDITNATIVNNKISVYVLVIPGCNVCNIRIMVCGKTSSSNGTYKDYITGVYTSSAATVETNNIITFNCIPRLQLSSVKKLFNSEIIFLSLFMQEYILIQY